jgi:uncharacterized membrane protein
MVRWSAWLRRAFIGASVAWAGALPLATYVAARPQTTAAPYLSALAVYMIGGAICHQRDERSFHLWAHQMPVCARCAGIYFGAALAAIAVGAGGFRRWRGPSPRVALGAAAIPALATLAFEWGIGITPGNALRAATGVVLGAAVGWVLVAGLSRPPERTTL